MSGQTLDNSGIKPLTLPDPQDEETSDCPLLKPSPPGVGVIQKNPSDITSIFHNLDHPPVEIIENPKFNQRNCDPNFDFLTIVKRSCKKIHDEPTSRDPMVESSSSSGSSSDLKEPVCTQLLTQLNTAYTHLAPDAQALFYNQDNGGLPPLVGIQLVVPKSPKDYGFMSWNWPVIRKTCFWMLMSLLAACTALVIGVISTMPRSCDPPVEWWQGSVFYQVPSLTNSRPNRFINVLSKLDNLHQLGIRGLHFYSIFPSFSTPSSLNDFRNGTSLTEVDENFGSMEEFEDLIRSSHQRNIAVILDLPVDSIIENLDDKFNPADRISPLDNDQILESITESVESSSIKSVTRFSSGFNIDTNKLNSRPNLLENSTVTRAIRFWLSKNIDGFYLRGLENLVNELRFADAMKYWKSIMGSNKIIICDEKVLQDAPAGLIRNVILSRVDLIDVTLDVSNGTKEIKTRIMQVLQGILFEKPGYPWILWKIKNIDQTRTIFQDDKHNNLMIAISMLEMMLPGSSNILHEQMESTHSVNEADSLDFAESLSDMSELRAKTSAIYVKAVIKQNAQVANCDVRYTLDELIVIERWYPRKNSLVLVANLGSTVQTKDLSSLYYGGHIVVGPKHKINQEIYFKKLSVLPGEAFVIKLDK